MEFHDRLLFRIPAASPRFDNRRTHRRLACPRGRTVTKNDYEAEYRAAQKKARTPEYARIRREHPAIERKLSELVRHHDLRHLFASTCIEAGVDIPTVSRWLGHKDGGGLAMKVYGHLRREHSAAQAQRVRFASSSGAASSCLCITHPPRDRHSRPARLPRQHAGTSMPAPTRSVTYTPPARCDRWSSRSTASRGASCRGPRSRPQP